MTHHWRVFWSDPNGLAGMAPVMAETEEEAYRQVLALHPLARVSAVDADQLDAKWMPNVMTDWLREWLGE